MNIPDTFLNDIIELSDEYKAARLMLNAALAQQAIAGMIEVNANLADFIKNQRMHEEKRNG